MKQQYAMRGTEKRVRWSICAIGGAGLLITGYLSASLLSGVGSSCTTQNCDLVLKSAWATLFNIPISLIGFVAYGGVIFLSILPLFGFWARNKKQAEEATWELLFLQTTAMASYSAYLMYILATKLKAVCLYCIGSALVSWALFCLTIFGRKWKDYGALFFKGIIVSLLTFVMAIGLHHLSIAQSSSSRLSGGGVQGITSTSGAAEIALARHLSKSGVVMYGAYWCPHCRAQKELFGKEAVGELTYVECDPKGKNSQWERCQKRGIQGYPTWEIKGKLYPGVLSLEELSELSSYRGRMNFKN